MLTFMRQSKTVTSNNRQFKPRLTRTA